MNNKEVIKHLKRIKKVLELNDASEDLLKTFSKVESRLNYPNHRDEDFTITDFKKLGFDDFWAEKVQSIIINRSLEKWAIEEQGIPEGVFKMLFIRYLGAKKVRKFWRNFGIHSVEALKQAAQNNQLIKVSGVGQKLQHHILTEIEFAEKYKPFWPYFKIEQTANELLNYLSAQPAVKNISISGAVRRLTPIVSKLEFVAACESFAILEDLLKDLDYITCDKINSSPFAWRGYRTEDNFPVEFKITSQDRFISTLFIHSADPLYLDQYRVADKPLKGLVEDQVFESESAIYRHYNFGFVFAEQREAQPNLKPEGQLIETQDLKGILHAHSTYSDGRSDLKTLAVHCKNLGYQYLGISDHSVSAYYAGGLNVKAIEKQHAEIEQLNTELSPFKIFKGIESDILMDGSLDYPTEILERFDFIIASIHTSLDMDLEKAMERLLKAIQNPYTTILGHLTGRILCQRRGYPVDHETIIKACAKHNVIIEINSNPRRLDLDWTWIPYCREQGVKLSINPDAHTLEGVSDVKYGVNMARKGGAEAKHILNTLSTKDLANFFERRF